MQTWENKLIREKLDSLEGLPEGYQPNLASKWQIIESGTEQKIKRIIPIYYWAAAAVVLIALCLSLFFTYTNNTDNNSNIAVTNKKPTETKQVITQKQVEEPAPEAIVTITRESNRKSNDNRRTVEVKPVQNESLPIANHQIITENRDNVIRIDTNTNAATVNEATTSIATAKPNKKKVFQKDFDGIAGITEIPSSNATQSFRVQIKLNSGSGNSSGQSPLLRLKPPF